MVLTTDVPFSLMEEHFSVLVQASKDDMFRNKFDEKGGGHDVCTR